MTAHDKDKADDETARAMFAAEEPFALFDAWLAEAAANEPSDPTAMALATVDGNGLPNARMVLMKEAAPGGIVFYTNTGSAKGGELAGQAKAAAVFHWKSIRRQVRFRGAIERVTEKEADAYFATRPRGAQIGAWASAQSRSLESRFALEKAVAKFTAKFGVKQVPRPEHWSGYRLVPVEIEFWRDRPFRLHDRLVFRRDSAAGKPWHAERLYP